MKQFTLSLFFLLFLSSLVAQRSHLVTTDGRTSPIKQQANSRFVADTISPAIFFDDCAETLFFTEASDGGYVAGTNDFSDKEKAQFLRYDETENYLINGVVGYFALYDNDIADRFISAKIYDVDPATDGPGNLLATTGSIQVQDILLDEVLILATYFPLLEPLAMDVADFFVSIDFADIYTAPTGNISLFMTEDGCGDGFNAWERWDNDDWYAIDEEDSWGLEAEFFIGAVVETAPSATHNLANKIELNVFPNPASERINLTYELDKSSEIELVLLDIQGREVLHKVVGSQVVGRNQIAMDLPGLPFGLYVYQLKTNGGVASGQVMIK